MQQLDEWRLEMRTKIEDIEESAMMDNNIRGHVEVLIKDNRISASKIQRLESDFVNLKLELSEDLTMNPRTSSDLSLVVKQAPIHLALKNQQEQIE